MVTVDYRLLLENLNKKVSNFIVLLKYDARITIHLENDLRCEKSFSNSFKLFRLIQKGIMTSIFNDN